jgi:transcriptional regulator with XRE-family HTH domain
MSEQTIGRALRTRRAELGLDQRDAAARIGMSRTTFSSYERDTQRPSVDVLPAIADFLGISIDDVLQLFGASAIAAARTALGRLSVSTSVSSAAPRIDTDIHTSDVVATSDVRPTQEFADGYVNSNGNGHDDDTADSSPYSPAVSIDATDVPHVKVNDEREKGKKKKKKKGKREKLANPAFASHV